MIKKIGIRTSLLIVFVLFSLLAINPKFNVEGVEITNIGDNVKESFSISERILEVNGKSFSSVKEFRELLIDGSKIDSKEISLLTNRGTINYFILNDLKFEVDENLTISNSNITGVFDGDVLKGVDGKNLESLSDFEDLNLLPKTKLEIKTNLRDYAFLVNEIPEIEVKLPSKTNIKKGLDLEGGTRVLLKPSGDVKATEQDIIDLMEVLRNRLNVYGLTDLKMRVASSGEEKLILIEMAGVSKEEIEGFISQQGKFEAKIANNLIFSGGKEDIPFVCRDDGVCAGVHGCSSSGGHIDGESICRFQFSIKLSPAAAERHANVTKDLEIIFSENGQGILSEQIEFYLDDNLIDSLNIDSSLRGSENTEIQITGPGFGVTEGDALDDAIKNMGELQTVLITGSLPFKLEIVSLDSTSPVFGQNLIKNIFIVSLAALISVLVVVYIRYRNFKILIPMAINLVSEIVIILGFASLFREFWTLDLAAIAGIIASVGTGVDDMIVITDEIIKGEKENYSNWKERIKKAFFIIVVAFFSTLVAMLPMWNAAAGLVRGFAVSIIIGIVIGVFITRPAFAAMLEKLMNKENSE